ncbi:hypothetical protein Sked_01210 [Sanguibacter keddieii DSM 10542]|uniref:Uncharacterized protein n=1 Tax=Sanguibacter keddieii (strain ATCC 51767 / DSM 10542 / NCFB 3025 / ST-74) TaxID=446469 RepID=D1BIQ1_SANKS|nr:hypothetical protein [Sanguibacter keddieii]ACZ20093.1 hypothetical protein Sked_01210 [Sanguibacter keddieii DSM 10542]
MYTLGYTLMVVSLLALLVSLFASRSWSRPVIKVGAVVFGIGAVVLLTGG